MVATTAAPDSAALAAAPPSLAAGAILAPHFKEGETDPAGWAAQLARPAPWGELGTAKFVAAAPRSSLLGVDDPSAVAAYYDRALDAISWLGSTPVERSYPQRIQTDVEIGGGWMHSGYPIMGADAGCRHRPAPRCRLCSRGLPPPGLLF